MGEMPSDCVQVTGKKCSQGAVASQPHELQRTSTRCAVAGSALAIVGAMRRSGEQTELAAVILIVMSLGLEVLALRRRHSHVQGTKPQHSVLERYKACIHLPSYQEIPGRSGCQDPLLLSTLRVFGPAFLSMTIFTAWGAGAVRHLGIVPRTLEGLPGVVFACFVHSSWPHFLWNAAGLALLAPFVLGAGANLLAASAFIALSSGFCVWCMARPALHAGASGVVCGYLGLLMAVVLRRRDVPLGTLLMVLGVVACYSGAFLLHRPGASLEPLYEACTSRSTSAEHHTFGFLSGLASALLFIIELDIVVATRDNTAKLGYFVDDTVVNPGLGIPFYKTVLEGQLLLWPEKVVRARLKQDLDEKNRALPDPKRTKAYIIPAGMGLILKKGTWHDFPVSCGPPVSAFILNTEEVVEALASMPQAGAEAEAFFCHIL
eukprot:g7155.t1